MKLTGLYDKIIVGHGEDKLFVGFRTVEEETVLSRSPQVARRIVVAMDTSRKYGVRIKVGHRIEYGWRAVTKSLIHCPHLDASRYLLVGAQRVGTLSVTIALSDLRDVAVDIHLLTLT